MAFIHTDFAFFQITVLITASLVLLEVVAPTSASLGFVAAQIPPMAEPAPLLCLPSASTSAPITPLRSNWSRSLPGNLPPFHPASASGALSCSVPPQVRHPSVPAELISGRLSSSPLQVVARRLGRLTFALRACCRSLLRGSLTQELRAAGSPPPTFAASSQVPSPSLPSHACRKLVHSAARPYPVKARFAGNPYSAAAPSAARSRSAWVPTLRRLRISPLAPLRPGRPSSPPLQRFARRACLGLRLLRATSGYSLRRLRQNPFRAHSAPPARTGANLPVHSRRQLAFRRLHSQPPSSAPWADCPPARFRLRSIPGNLLPLRHSSASVAAPATADRRAFSCPLQAGSASADCPPVRFAQGSFAAPAYAAARPKLHSLPPNLRRLRIGTLAAQQPWRPAPASDSTSRAPSPSLPSHSCRKLFHSAARPLSRQTRFTGLCREPCIVLR